MFHDRLISADDKLLVTDRLSQLVEQKFPTMSQHVLQSPILFGDFRWVSRRRRGQEEAAAGSISSSSFLLMAAAVMPHSLHLMHTVTCLYLTATQAGNIDQHVLRSIKLVAIRSHLRCCSSTAPAQAAQPCNPMIASPQYVLHVMAC